MQITLNIHGMPIQCYSELDDAFDNFGEVNKVMKRLGLYLQNILRIYSVENTKVFLLVADSVSLSPVTLLDDLVYYIVFPIKLFTNFTKRLETIYAIPEFQNYFHFKNEMMDEYIRRTFDWICNFALLHELFHVLNGHLVYKLKLKTQKNYVSGDDKQLSLNFQTMELDADYCAVVEMTRGLISIFYNMDMRKDRSDSDVLQYIIDDLIFMNVALCVSFSTFVDSRSIKNNDYLSIAHPTVDIRSSYALEIIYYEINKTFEGLFSEKLFYKISEITIACNRIYFANNNFSNSLVCSAYSKEAVNHKMLLHNNWNNIYEQLQEYALLELHKKEELSDLTYWVDENKKIMPIILKA